MSSIDELRQECWNKAFYCFGTGYIFEKRVGEGRWRLRLVTFFSLLFPLIVGGWGLSFGFDASHFGTLVKWCAGGAAIQLILVLWSVTSRWEDEWSYSKESSTHNYRLAKEYETLAKFPAETFEDYKTKIEMVNASSDWRDTSDTQHVVTEKEKRKGYRYALRKYRKECSSCKEIPTGMKPGDCDVCGSF